MIGTSLKQELSPSEYRIVQHIAMGLTCKVIAGELGRSVSGVREQLKKIQEKTMMSSKHELACRYAWELKEAGDEYASGVPEISCSHASSFGLPNVRIR